MDKETAEKFRSLMHEYWEAERQVSQALFRMKEANTALGHLLVNQKEQSGSQLAFPNL